MVGVAGGAFSGWVLLQEMVWSNTVGRLLMGDIEDKLSLGELPRHTKLQFSTSAFVRLLLSD